MKSLVSAATTTTILKKEPRKKLIRVTEKTYMKLAKMGDLTEDFEDVVARLLKYYEDREGQPPQRRS